ncbi:YceI family protein [Sulfurimonas sp. C5]|uniref:YceI family protein n=1 Tax=Sulfurimonas sp. C5 TaxID=3036947 RepID=UPI00245578A0|nr:YceI family protein [Sulfurimonas sp. C5]MDH4945294.1 YceI family protein [Sulfurimonas sp. C5]
MKKLYVAFIALMLGAGVLFGATYKVDPVHTNVMFKVKHMMISHVTGKFEKFDGSFEVNGNNLIALKGEIEAASLNTDKKERDEHLRSADFFDVAKYPKITFVLDHVDGDKAYGKLTIKDVTKDVVLDYEFGGVMKDPWGQTRAGLTLEGKINRKDFGLKWNKVLETGGVLVGDTVKMEVSVEGILQQ